MTDPKVHRRTWHELARCPAPVEARLLWQAILEKTEHPERYNGALARADLLDHDAQVVVRRTIPREGEAFIEWVAHERCATRVEVRRGGHAWRRAQALVVAEDGAWLVYEVDDVEEAAAVAGIDEAHATHVLARLVASAQARALVSA